MLANYLIGLREGLEASLVVSILATFLVKSGHRDRLKLVWIGVGAAVGVAVAGWALLQFITSLTANSFTTQETIGGVMSIIAVGFVTWMIFWMRKASRGIARELRDRMGLALEIGSRAVVVLAFLAVFREGIETAFIVYASAATATTATPFIGVLLGLATSVVLGFLIYRGAVRINLAVFFKWTGAILILVAAGIFAYGFHDLQEANILPGLDSLAFDISHVIPPDSWYGVLLKGIFNFNPAPTVVEAVAWLAYLVPVLVLYFRPLKPTTPPSAVAAEARTNAA
ncbi:high-affinity iron transporter [Kribbella orskensis]|uniref:High-affinity iron transporter n=1 Tax=Kribbella orskensis TaxID=2512216 RepID=A0ABY2B7R4_9ACTN|nr:MULTISPECIES: iron uptake transporter permease EfeU [Kribbella]TCN29963.1 high-affinity iron transporter [Kribbella sp. VKM Ac-2500]TCO10125.1 high-affinity iron transporter [Kribbella orskensis]